MTRVLYAASIATTVAAGVLIVLVAEPGLLHGPGARGEIQIRGFLNGPSAVDRFKRTHNRRSQDQGHSVPSVIRQAELFASIINPLPEVSTSGGAGPHQEHEKPDEPPPTDFRLLGTSYSPDSGLSFAYVHLVDQTCRWVREGDRVRHTTVEEIQHGSIAYSRVSGKGVMAVESVPETAARLDH